MAQQDYALVAQKWLRNTQGSVASYKAAIEAVKTNPAELALAKESEYVAGVQRAVQEGKWQQGLRRVTLANWKALTLKKGAARFADGAAQAVGKVEDFMAQLLPYTAKVQAEIRTMPKGTYQDSVARMIRAMDMMKEFTYLPRPRQV